MSKRFNLKFLPVGHFRLGDASFQSIEVGDRQVVLVSVPDLNEESLEEFKRIWQDVVGNGVDLLLCNYPVDLSTFEITEIDPLEEDKKALTCLDRVLLGDEQLNL
jgi:hypothetical protein